MSIEKIQKELKGKTCVFDQDYLVVKQFVNLIDDKEFVTKDEKNYVTYFSKMPKEKESNLVQFQ